MFSLPKLDVGSLDKICSNSGVNIIFGIVLAFLVMVLIQSLDSEISPSCPMFKSQNNLCLKQMDIINETCLFGLLNNPVVIFIFILLLNCVLTYLVFTIFQSVLNKSNFCEGLSSSVSSCPIIGGSKPKHIIMSDTTVDYLTGCPLGFGKKKFNNIKKECNFIDECMLIKEKMCDMKNNINGDNADIDVKIERNVNLNNDNSVGTKLVKNILEKFVPGLLPNIIETITNKCDMKKCDEKKCDMKKCDESKCDESKCDMKKCDESKCDMKKCDMKKCDESKCDMKKCDMKKCDESKCDESKCENKEELFGNIKNIMTKITGLLNDGNIDMKEFNLDFLNL
jgi:uncharacterized protein YjbI with pentapeptide repeats